MTSTALIPHAGTSAHFAQLRSIGTLPERQFPIPRATYRTRLDAGVPLTLFPEGTSTGGDDVLPFRSSLFDPVVKLGCPVTACALRYSLEGGSVADEVAYWRDMTLAPHLLNLLGKSGVTLDMHFGPTSRRTGDRKTLARELHAEVRALLHGRAA